MAQNMGGDLRLALRMLARRPLFTAAIGASLALGIGANSAVFSIAKAFFLQPLPVEEPSRLVAIYTADAKNPGFFEASFPNYLDLRAQTRSFSGLLAHHLIGLSLAGGSEPEVVFGEIVSGNYFDVLGVKPALGRFFLPEEDSTADTHPVAVLSYGLWQRRFGADPRLIGGTIVLNNRKFTVIGVAPKSFLGTDIGFAPALWVPLMTYRATLPAPELFNDRRALLFWMIGRLRPGTDLAAATAEMKTLASRLEVAYPAANKERGVTLLPLAEATLNPNVRQGAILTAGLLFAVTGIVLLVACANVASLLLARALGRRQELAIRLSLGASRGQLIRQLLIESLLLSLLGGATGLLLAALLPRAVWALLPALPIPVTLDLTLDLRVLGFTLLLALLTGFVFGLTPALQATRLEHVTALKDRGGEREGQGRRLTLRRVLVVVQVCLCLVSLHTAGLFVRSLNNAQRVDPGFAADRLGVMTFSLGAQGYSKDQVIQAYDRMLAQVRAVPGIEDATLASYQPLSGGFNRSVILGGDESRSGVLVATNVVGPHYFGTLGIPIVRGREFNGFDRPDSVRIAIVNQAMADRFWPRQNPVGERFRFFGMEAPLEVVGVARDSKYRSLGEDPTPYIYLPLSQNYVDAMVLHVRAAGNPAAALLAARREIQTLDPSLPLVEVATVSDLLGRSLWAPRMGASAFGFFGLLTLLLAAVGIYGLMAYSVTQRIPEIGIRMALGARPSEIRWLVLRQGMSLIGFGIGLGIAAALALTRVLASLLYGVSATDPMALGSVTLLLVGVALLSIYFPSMRATGVDPMVSLRG